MLSCVPRRNLAGASGDQRLAQRLTESPIRAGDQCDRSRDVHVVPHLLIGRRLRAAERFVMECTLPRPLAIVDAVALDFVS